MQLKELFAVQKTLNERIVREHQLDPAELKNKKYLALLTEIGELANETRCFKYWSKKDPSPREKILEEYVDCLHFILTIGIDLGFEDVVPDHNLETMDLTTHFLNLFLAVNELVSFSSMNSYEVLVEDFFALGIALGFSVEEVQAAYFSKNKINHQRQDAHY